ncbi:AI-2E family transporter [Crossiella sp. CA-258035]|uniref:AI-2E family transporter n=1 Tax=Crossiella sp. CA-258035 TaxID=2981138 RepID=UPI0024BC48EB|nr:AI-2E family transporter [Crossiella sp. CA-258035]WHT19477.1 AI-2E family transporter [Crossiella sp. CA-258035]
MSSRRQVPPTPIRREVVEQVPYGLRVSAALSWRFLTLCGALAVLVFLVGYFAGLVIPVGIALLLAALMAPAVRQLVSWRVPGWAATTIVLVGGLLLVVGVLVSVVAAFVNGVPELQSKVVVGLDQIKDWLVHGPLQLTQQDLDQYLNRFVEMLKSNVSTIATNAVNTTVTTAVGVGELLTGFLLLLFTLIFFLHDGSNIWHFMTKAVPGNVRDRVDVAGRRGFASLVSYVRATVVVAVVDAVGIGIGLAIVGVPLAVPLAALVFLAAFVPIIGSLVAGSVAVLVALVANGPIEALIVLIIVIAVMQLESHVLQPLLLGKAVSLHPLAVILVIMGGLSLAGIPGALLGVPVLAVLNAAIRSLVNEDNPDPDSVDPTNRADAIPSGKGDEPA